MSFGLNTRDWYGGRVPLAVNTILLGMRLRPAKLERKKNVLICEIGLAVLPTWLVIQRHNPIEHDENEAKSERGDEEHGVVQNVNVVGKGT